MNPVKEWTNKVVLRTCEELSLPVDLVLAVHHDQFKRAKNAAKTHNTIEFSGLGKFTARSTVIERKLQDFTRLSNAWERAKEEHTDPSKIHTLNTKINNLSHTIESLKQRSERLKNENTH